ncbi:MAG: sulfur carrier protein ThiS [Planctomycetota bacterium]
MIEIQVNGQSTAVSEGTTVAALLAQLELDNRPVAVELNLQLVPKARHAATVVSAGDRVEVVTLVGGG